jgi:hypothetical protein
MSWISTSCDEPASLLTSSIASLQAEQPALKNLNFLSYAHDVVLNAPLFELSVAFMGLGEIATSLRAVSRGQAFHSEAMTKNPTAPYMAA